MELITKIPVQQINHSRINQADFNKLEFGKYISDHMLVCDFINEQWQEPAIVPYSNLSLSPAALALHYGQTVFEGMKAFRMNDGSINIFRIQKHYERFVKSLERMCMAIVPEEIFTEGLQQLVNLDRKWVPAKEGTALYIRPFVIATEAKLGLKISDEYRFMIFTSPVPALFSSAVKVKIETNYVRASKGGTGFAKCGGNYAASLLPTKKANSEGYDQVLWTDSKNNKFIEESGVMNVMFVINNILVTPPLSDSILDGVTRDSLLTLAKDNGYRVQERQVSIAELKEGICNGNITEAFGAGTAAVISPISTICIHEKDYHLPVYNEDSVMFKLKKRLDGIRYGLEGDVYDWNCVL